MRLFKMALMVVAAVFSFWLTSASPADAKVTKAVLRAAPAEFRGTCPGGISFTGSITADAPGKVTYIFTRSDGAKDTRVKTLFFRRAGTQSVKTTWTLGGSTLPYYAGWEAIKVLSPNPFTSKTARFRLKCDPPLNSAISAHGNTDWHVNTANEFLFGVDMDGNATAPNHAPDGWTKQHMHVGLNETSKYYFDKSLTSSGADTDQSSGIDRAMLFFYAGHGNPELWSTLDDTYADHGTQKDVKLANITGNGNLRYYWQCSCEVFAHGPESTSACTGASMSYGCPQKFDGSHDSGSMRNVFERWGPALNPDLRMACGGSTPMYCWYNNVDKVWDDFNNNGMSVAASFIDGFSGAGVVPLCITMGGSDIAKTPLYTDTSFTNKPNTSGSQYYHIMYLGGAGTQQKSASKGLVPAKLPRLIVTAAELPKRLSTIGASEKISDRSFLGNTARLKTNPASGAVHLVSERQVPSIEKPLDERQYLSKSAALVKEMQWESPDMAQPVVSKLMTASMPVGGKTKDIRQGQESVIVKYAREVEVNGVKVKVLGPGGNVKIVMTAGGNVLSANRVWRKIVGKTAETPLKTFEEAEAEAARRLPNSEAYKLDHWDWGYKEPSGNVSATELSVVYQFGFVAKSPEDMLKYPPVFLEIPAEKR